MTRKVDRCRICGGARLEEVLDLGEQCLTGWFPREANAPITKGPLVLVKCIGEPEACGLIQLAHSYDADEMYGANYGYRSGLNASMVAHLKAKVERITGRESLKSGDLIIDIGANDGTTLGFYPSEGLTLVGIDPTAKKFARYYPPHVNFIADFFSSEVMEEHFAGRKARVITSFSMFYDLESPMAFMRTIHDNLADDGLWVFEQSYMPSMLATNSYDTVCHEHLEFYGLGQIKWMADRVGFDIVDVELNDVNGGSFSVSVKKGRSGNPPPTVQKILADEAEQGLATLAPFRAFEQRTHASREALRGFVADARAAGKTVAALGASTKGNVLLQYCGFTRSDISAIGEVNPDKFGSFAPGGDIPIIPEAELLARNPDYLIVLPWHFRSFFESSAVFRGRTLVFPLPEIELVTP